MLSADLADTPLASHRPDIEGDCDSLADQLREVLARFIPRDSQPAAFRALDAVLDAAGASVSAADREQIAAGILYAVYGDTSHEASIRYIAAAALKRLGKDGRSYQAIGDEFGVTRACIHEHSRRIEKRTNLKCRSDKDADARRTSADRATGRRRAKTSGTLRPRGGLRGLFSVFKLRGV